MDTYLVKYNFNGDKQEKTFNDKVKAKAFIDERIGLPEFKNFKVYKLCNSDFLD